MLFRSCDQIANSGFSVPFVATTTRYNVANTQGTAAQYTGVFQDRVSGNTYRLSAVLGYGFQNSWCMIEQLN